MISTSFADIFYNNCFKNGILPIVLPQEDVEKLMDDAERGANAVLTALRERRIPTSTFEAIGFGEENPIADNSTEEGREANRRIEFSLIVPPSTIEETSTLDALAAEAPDEESAEPALPHVDDTAAESE